jgi:O-antigen ligase
MERALAKAEIASTWVHAPFLALVALSAFLVSGPWAGFHGVMLGVAGLLVVLRPPVAALPTSWWLLAAAFIVLGCAVFLPAAWFGIPDWRRGLEDLGLQTGDRVAIQSRQAGEMLALFALMLLVGLWLAGHRASAETLRRCALAFVVAVAAYAVIARWTSLNAAATGRLEPNQFGFFPNRNHTATYLAMGAICGLGATLQAARDKRWWLLATALAATTTCLWAIAAWSISRAGVVLVAVGLLAWLPMLGRRYLGRHGLWAIGLIVLTAAGWFLITDTEVKKRLSDTVEKAGSVAAPAVIPNPDGGKSALDSSQHLDFRIPVFLDTLEMIGNYPWTGIGAGQFHSLFPQYRKRTIVANDSDVYHPESDWLWLAAETGVPATLALLALVVLAIWISLKGILQGRDRALRAACLIAAMLVPVHGIFDVPGHRITLAWSALFLFALSLPPSAAALPRHTPRAWPSRLFALCLLAASALLIRAQWGGGPQPAVTAAAHAIARAQQLYSEDQALEQAALAAGREYQPDPAVDKLEQALAILDAAKPLAPLNRELPRHEAFFALHFDDKYDRVDRAFAIDRALDPAWVAGPLRQAEAWAPIDPQKTASLWAEALRRARSIDRLDPANHRASAKTLENMRNFSRKSPELEALLPQP